MSLYDTPHACVCCRPTCPHPACRDSHSAHCHVCGYSLDERPECDNSLAADRAARGTAICEVCCWCEQCSDVRAVAS